MNLESRLRYDPSGRTRNDGSMSEPILRSATRADVPALSDTVQQGFEGYRAWAPRGWDPPDAALHGSSIRARLADPACFCLLAEAGPTLEPAGHVAYLPATGERAVAHVWMLFVRERWWGTGLATELLRRAVAAATDAGYRGMRLHTPAEHGRARAFYEREGWRLDGESFHDPMLGLALVTYRRGIARPTGDQV